MKLLSVATADTKPSVCPRCGLPVMLVRFDVRGAYGANGRARVRGSYWAVSAAHGCARTSPVVEIPARERAP